LDLGINKIGEKYMFPDDAEKTLTSLITSKMIGREVKYIQVLDNPEDESDEVVLQRGYMVDIFKIYKKK